MSELKIRALIQEAGIPTFPRPKGIPDNFVVQITDKGAGIKYIHPTNTHISVRLMPGKPHSPHPYQQNPYVIQRNSGKAYDQLGNLVLKNAPEARIPIKDFQFRN